MSTSFRLRRFQPSDLPELILLFRETVQRINCQDYSPEQIAAWAPNDVNLARWQTLAERYTIVAEAEAASSPSGGSNSFSKPQLLGFADLEPDGHLDRFFVQADHQCQGVGTAILENLVAAAQRLGISRLFAEVSLTARPFFERNGFVVLKQQQVAVRDVLFTNFAMERQLAQPST